MAPSGDKFKTDLEAKSKGEGDELAKLRVERDTLKAAAEKHAAETSELHREYKLREALSKAGLRDADAIKMLDTSSATIDDKGNLIGPPNTGRDGATHTVWTGWSSVECEISA